MKCRHHPKQKSDVALALVMVLVFVAVGLTALAGVMAWSSLVATNSDRYKTYLGGIAVTDAVLEKATGKMIHDFQAKDQNYIASHLSDYKPLVPTASESPAMANFQFSDLTYHLNQISIDNIAGWGFGDLSTKFSGLKGYSATYKLTGSVKDLTSRSQVPVTVQQQLQLASIPLFGFGVFYNLDLELCPNTNFTVYGRVHGNSDIYTEPSGNLVFATNVTASGEIVPHKAAEDPTQRSAGLVGFNGETEGRVTSFVLPMGTNNSASVLHKILEVPSVGESATSLIGKQRYYNKADMLIFVKTNSIVLMSGSYNNFSASYSGYLAGILTTNTSFFDKREYMQVRPMDLDITQLRTYYTNLITFLGRPPLTIYIVDERPFPSSYMPAVRIINGGTLPSGGLTVATPHPLYIKGNFNVPSGYAGTTNTALCPAASLGSDAITFLSANWSDANSGNALSSRIASTGITINSAVITGIVPSGNGFYSGGLENVFRLLEDWTGQTLVYNGAIAVLYDSRQAVGPWVSGSDVYLAPTRTYTWNTKFQQENQWPPATPFISAAFRSKWNALAPL
jgi:hypothetical protein